VIGPGNGAVGAPEVLFDRPKILLKVWVVKEPRRGREADSLGGLLFSLLLAMLVVVNGLILSNRAFDTTQLILSKS